MIESCRRSGRTRDGRTKDQGRLLGIRTARRHRKTDMGMKHACKHAVWLEDDVHGDYSETMARDKPGSARCIYTAGICGHSQAVGLGTRNRSTTVGNFSCVGE